MPSSAEGAGAQSAGVQAAKRTPETRRMFELLDDGEWHYLKDIISEMARKVHPGQATRYVEQQRASQATGKPRVKELSVEGQVLSGKRGRANAALKGALNRGALEVKDQNTDKPQVRLAPHYRFWSTERLATYLGTKQGTVQGWAKNPRIIEEVRAFMPDGMDPIVKGNTLFGERQVYLFDPLSIPGWKRWWLVRDSLGDDRTNNKHLRILESVQNAMALTDSPEDEEKAIVIAGRLRRELDKRELYIAVRQPNRINGRVNRRTE